MIMTKNLLPLMALLLVSVVFISGCVTDAGTTQPEQTTTPKTISLSEVARHGNAQDCWLAIHGKVYDVTNFIDKHPGGQAILQGCGKDATNLFETRPMGSGTPHSSGARDMLANYYIGDLA